jgi:hypothetical protein
MVAEDTFEGGREALEIEQRLVDIEDDEGKSGHGGLHRLSMIPKSVQRSSEKIMLKQEARAG